MKLPAFVTVAFLPLLAAAGCHPDTRTYEFAARVKSNGGVTPFPVGSTIIGRFTYDTAADHQSSRDPVIGRYTSPRNALIFQHANHRLSGAGKVMVTTSRFDHAEHFGIVAHDLELPHGWDMDHFGRSDSYGIILQNAPPRGAVPNDGIPDHVDLSSYVSTRELRLDFFHGVRFPGGHVDGRAVVSATLETIALVPNDEE